jgi:hypothetical protein
LAVFSAIPDRECERITGAAGFRFHFQGSLDSYREEWLTFR